jgi:hypothetical protein
MNASVLVNWTYQGTDDTGFLLERSTDSGSSYPLEWGFDKNTLTYTDTDVVVNGTYWYRVAARNTNGLGGFSNLAVVFISPPAFDQTLLTASQYNYELQVNLSWSYSGSSQGNTDFFLVEKSSDLGATYPVSWSVTAPASTWSDNLPMTYSSYYDYRVTPHIDLNLYGPPSNVSRSFMQAPIGTVYTWQTGSSAIAFWNYLGTYSMSLSRSADGGVTWPLTTVITPSSSSTYYFIDNSTSAGTTYTYRIQEIARPNQPNSTGPEKTILQYSTTTSLAYASDPGYDYSNVGDLITWELHTASLLQANDSARGQFSISRFLLGGDEGHVNWHGGYQFLTFQLLGPTESIWPTFGNHDQADMGGGAAFIHYFGLRTVNYTWKEGCVQGFVIQTVSETDTTMTSGSAPWLFLSRSLSSSLNDPSVAWRIAMIHSSPICSPFLHPPNPLASAIPWQQWGVNIVFSGHNHIAERLESGSVLHVMNGTFANSKTNYYLRGSPHPYSKNIFSNANDGNGPYFKGYLWNNILATPQYLSMSFYSGSTKVPDTSSTSIPGAHMDGGSFIWQHLPPLATPSLTSSTLSV